MTDRSTCHDPSPGPRRLRRGLTLAALILGVLVPARMIEIISPAGFEHFFRELAEMVGSGAANLERADPPGPASRSSADPGRTETTVFVRAAEVHGADWKFDVGSRFVGTEAVARTTGNRLTFLLLRLKENRKPQPWKF